MASWFARRFLDLLGSIYIYNEHRGYTAIDRVIEVARARGEVSLVGALERHRADERKHYVMFRRWFALRGAMPFAVDRTIGHIDRFVEIMFGMPIDRLDTDVLIASDEAFGRLCRVVALTERRGYTQVEKLLRNPHVLADPALTRIFQIIRRDEPSHWEPYEGWLASAGARVPDRRERAIDGMIHSELILLKLPALFLNPRLARRTDWVDAADQTRNL